MLFCLLSWGKKTRCHIQLKLEVRATALIGWNMQLYDHIFDGDDPYLHQSQSGLRHRAEPTSVIADQY